MLAKKTLQSFSSEYTAEPTPMAPQLSQLLVCYEKLVWEDISVIITIHTNFRKVFKK